MASAWDEVDKLKAKLERGHALSDAQLREKRPRGRPVEKRAMTSGEQKLAHALGGCSFTPATFDKRFARDISGAASEPEPRITERQAALLRRLVTRYRRQIRATELPEDERYLLTEEHWRKTREVRDAS